MSLCSLLTRERSSIGQFEARIRLGWAQFPFVLVFLEEGRPSMIVLEYIVNFLVGHDELWMRSWPDREIGNAKRSNSLLVARRCSLFTTQMPDRLK